jgi:AraC-like DNA-binding protein
MAAANIAGSGLRGLAAATPRALDPLGMPALARPEGGTLPGRETYGQSIARLFNVDAAPTMTTTGLKTAQLAVSRLSSDRAGDGRTAPLPAERAYAVMLHLKDAGGARLWKAGRAVVLEPIVAGSIIIADLQDEPHFDLRSPFDALLMHLPRIAFEELADEHGAPRISALQDCAGAPDPLVHDLGRALLPCIGAPGYAPQLFFDHVALAICVRLAARHGALGLETPLRPAGGLSVRQERMAKDALVADLAEEPPLASIARACGMPVGRFIRAFRLTTGMPPFRWVRAFRVERAKDLLLNSPLALAQIAYDCGFADQSHFTRVFTAAVGTTPGAWRRARRA